ncbi:NUDIX domain-containing protein [Gammaproteobacteria bacterium AS21]
MQVSQSNGSFKQPLFSVDAVLFSIVDSKLSVLLVDRAIAPYKGCWALPGGYVDVDIDTCTDSTARRKLKEKTGVEPPYLEQLQSFSGADRDPRGYSVTLAYYALVGYQLVSSNVHTVDDAKWWDIASLADLNLAFDHQLIIESALHRVQQKSLYSMLPVYCLAKQFTIAQLKLAIEIIIGKSIQRKSLIRRIEASDMFELMDQKIASGGRLAQVYQLKENVDLISFERNFSR